MTTAKVQRLANRRAVLGAALAAGAVGATAAIPAPARAAPALSALDRRILNLWRWRAKLKVIADHRWEQLLAARKRSPPGRTAV